MDINVVARNDVAMVNSTVYISLLIPFQNIYEPVISSIFSSLKANPIDVPTAILSIGDTSMDPIIVIILFVRRPIVDINAALIKSRLNL